MTQALQYNVDDLRRFLVHKGKHLANTRKAEVAQAIAKQFDIQELHEYMRCTPPVPKRTRKGTKAAPSDTASTASTSVGSASSSASSSAAASERQTQLTDFFLGRREEYAVGQKLSCIYTDGDRANARRIITVLEHIALHDGPGIRVEEEDAEGIGRDVSSYYISKMEGVMPLERAARSEENA